MDIFIFFVGIFSFAISASRTQARLKHSRPNIVAMRRIPYNIKKGQLQTSAFQTISPRLKCDAAMVWFFILEFVDCLLSLCYGMVIFISVDCLLSLCYMIFLLESISSVLCYCNVKSVLFDKLVRFQNKTVN
jgi:hypothetical protein